MFVVPTTAILLLCWSGLALGQPSRRAQCAIECYSKCMLAGTPNAVYCNCPVAKSARICVGASEEFLQRKIADDELAASTEYISAHSIRIATTSLPRTFMNIFEYTELENLNKPNAKWTFAGASSGHDLTFSVSDPCKEYAYRVISILKTGDAENYLTVYRPQAIPVNLPSFSVDPELIKLDEPEFSHSEESITVTAIWMNPGGYLDTDISGVEAPEAYPIQCQSPEGELPDPNVELFYNGGRLSVNLPSEVLSERCRFLFQVKVLPKCERLDPFSVQTTIEVNCENFPSHPICTRERAPQCTNIVDVWGSSKNATVMWKFKDQSDKPLYYHIRHGPVEAKGTVPFVNWKITKGKEEKVRPEVNSIELEVQSDANYGVQVCAVYSKLFKVPKFDLVSVTPFLCTPCSVSDSVTGAWFSKCDECTKIEGEVVAKAAPSFAAPIKVISVEPPRLDVEDKKATAKLAPVIETKATPKPTTVTVASTVTSTTTKHVEPTMPPTSIDLEEQSNDVSEEESLLFPPIASRATEEATTPSPPTTPSAPPKPTTLTPREIRKHYKSKTPTTPAPDCVNPLLDCLCTTDTRCCFLSSADANCVRRTNKTSAGAAKEASTSTSTSPASTFCLAKEDFNVTYELNSRTARVRAHPALENKIVDARADRIWIGWKPSSALARVTPDDVIDASAVTKSGMLTKKPYMLKMIKGATVAAYEVKICLVNNTDFEANKVMFILDDESLKQSNWNQSKDTDLMEASGLSQFFLFYGPLSAIFVLVVIVIGIIYLNCARIRRFYERKRIYTVKPGPLRTAYRPYTTQYTRGPYYNYGNTRVYHA